MKLTKFTEESLLFSIVKVAESIKRDVSSELKPERVNFYQALILIGLYSERKAKLTPNDFCKSLNLPKAVVSQSLTHLVELKFIKRALNELDARKTWLNLTPQGEKKAIALINTFHKLDKKVETKLSRSDVKQILAFLKNI